MSEATAWRAGWDCHVHVFDSSAPVATGHYQPAQRPLAQIEALAAAHGVQHLVLVQPSVYGTDNRLLLQALQVEPGRHRGVVVLDDSIDEGTLDLMHQAGVRGARFNRVSPVGENGLDIEARFQALAPRLQARGWHLQWYAAPEHLASIARLHAGSGVVAVLDHLAGLHAELPPAHPAWLALQALADLGAWVKLSGWYRLRAVEPYDTLSGHLRRVASLFGDRLVWGSDWPHTSFGTAPVPSYASILQPVLAALDARQLQALQAAPQRLYGD